MLRGNYYKVKFVLRNCSVVGVLIAQPLLRQKKMTGTSNTAAKFKAAWKSPYVKILPSKDIDYEENSVNSSELVLIPHWCHHLQSM